MSKAKLYAFDNVIYEDEDKKNGNRSTTNRQSVCKAPSNGSEEMEEKINDFATRYYDNNSKRTSIRMSKRHNAHKHYNDDIVSEGPAETIMQRGDAVRLTWKGVSVKTLTKTSLIGKATGKAQKEPKTILDNITGGVEPGTLLAIMGSSGAGKSTFLNVLTYRHRENLNITGEIKVNGLELGQHITNVSAYVQQDDLFIGALTVKEHLLFTANLRMKASVSKEDKLARVEEVMMQMGLKKCESVVIGTPGRTKTISGGEMKRLSFAAELLTNPPLMFCDEPTSGLDSYLAQILCQSLQKITKQGCTVLCTIHQPSSEVFELFDNLLLLALGKVVFMGKSKDALQYYNQIGYPCPVNYNPADHYIMEISVTPGKEQECKEKIGRINEQYKESSLAAEMKKMTDESVDNDGMALSTIAIPTSPYRVNFATQFYACFRRGLITNYRNPLIVRVRFAQTVFVALLVGLIYLRPYGSPYTSSDIRNVSGSLFLIIINLTFSYTFGVINAFPSEIPIFRREHFNGMYSTTAYFWAKNLAELPMYLLFPLVYDVIVYFMFGLEPDAHHFFVFYGITILMVAVCVSFGYMVSTMSPNVTVALAIAPPLLTPLLLFGGFFISAGSIPPYFIWLKYLSWFFYTNEMLNINQWQDVDHISCDTAPPAFSEVTFAPPDISSLANSTIAKLNETLLDPSIICGSLENLTATYSLCPYSTGSQIIAAFDFDEGNMGRDVGIMFALLFGFRIIAFLVLVYKSRDSTR